MFFEVNFVVDLSRSPFKHFDGIIPKNNISGKLPKYNLDSNLLVFLLLLVILDFPQELRNGIIS